MEKIIPEKLKIGDEIRIVAPSRSLKVLKEDIIEISTEKLEKNGLHVIRFCNLDIDRNFYGVCTVIDMEVKKRIQDT